MARTASRTITPTTVRNKAAAVTVHARAIPGNHTELVAALVSPDFDNHDAVPGCEGGLDGLLATMHWFSDAFSDQRVDVLHAVAEGDLVALHVTFTATHSGYFRGIASTGRRFAVREMHMLRFADGREAEHWVVRDDTALLRALTQVPAPPTT